MGTMMAECALDVCFRCVLWMYGKEQKVATVGEVRADALTCA